MLLEEHRPSYTYGNDGATGLHISLDPEWTPDCALKDVQYCVKQDGTTAKAASPAAPPSALE